LSANFSLYCIVLYKINQYFGATKRCDGSGHTVADHSSYGQLPVRANSMRAGVRVSVRAGDCPFPVETKAGAPHPLVPFNFNHIWRRLSFDDRWRQGKK